MGDAEDTRTQRMITLMTADGGSLGVTETMALQLHIAGDAIKNDSAGNPIYALPLTKNITTMVISFCKNNNAEFVKEVDPLTLFDLIEAAHHFQITVLMDLACQTLVSKIKRLTDFKEQFITNQNYDWSSSGKHSKWAYSYRDRIIRQRGKETLIQKSNFVGVNRSPFVNSLLEFIKRRDEIFDGTVRELLKFKKKEEWENEDLDDLYMMIKPLEVSICGDPALAARVRKRVIEILFRFLGKDSVSWEEDSALHEIQRSVLRILSHVRFDLHCSFQDTDGIVILLNYMSTIPSKPYTAMAVAALKNMACAFPKLFKYMVDKALNVVEKIVKICANTEIVGNVAKFMAAICREKELELYKKDVALNILQTLLQMNFISQQPIEQACYALQYLTYDGKLKIEGEAFNKLSGRLIFIIRQQRGIKDPSFPGYALGVVGNIARWATSDQIKILTSELMLLECLGSVFLCTSKKIKKEACQIISNMAANGGISIEDMYTTKLIAPLCDLLEEEGFDVKMEAAWAIFNGICGFQISPENDNFSRE
ncbi:hypothetical protein POM88_053930 [Heracleum sosnowskyi]|uniref:Uncharacterized protein n=1 Tax=Heracleum sosnowskyi TaxID=360622 RepID=A0AAD8GPN4_9APIA|nr:hypothetical protein POM88_053930 [Heracleum sosnowskyi]